MKKDGIFFKIFTALLLTAAAVVPAAATGNEYRQPFTVSGEGEDLRSGELLRLYRHLNSLYHLNPRRSPVSLEVVLSPAVPADAPEIRCAGTKWTAAINNDPAIFASSAVLRQRLYSIMLMAASGTGAGTGRTPSTLPAVTFLGIDSIINGWQGPERWVRGNRRLNVIRALLGAKRLPETAKWLPEAAETPGDLSPAAYIWCSELARVALESGGRNLFNRRRLAGYLTPGGRNDLEFINGLAGGGEAADRKLYFQAVRLAWSEYNPRPGELTLQELALWRQRPVEELGADGKPTGKTGTMDIAALFPLLRSRPDARRLISEAAASLLNLAGGDSREFKAAATRTAQMIMALEQQEYPENPEEVLQHIARLAEITRSRIALGKILDAAASEHTPLAVSCGLRLQTVRTTPQVASQAVSRYLDRAAENF